MEPRYRFRLYILTVLIFIGCGTLLTRLHDFQIKRRDEFLQMVPGNRIVTVREPGIRGEITDRNGIALARNLRNYEVSFNLDEIRGAYRLQYVEDPTLERLTKEGGLPRRRKEKDIVAIVNEWTIARLNQLGLAKNYSAGAMRSHYLTHGGLIPFSYRADLTYEDFARYAEHSLELPGVYLNTRPKREYPYGALASHVIGHLKQWEKGDIPESAARQFNHYVGEDKGIAGVEATMDELLRGPAGQKTIVKDAKGRNIGMYDYVKPGIGARVELTIDARVQYMVENVLRRVGRGAAVVMDVNTGEVLAMASVPDYNPNDFIPSISRDQFAGYNNNPFSPFTNRTIASFTPGSTMKVATAIAGAVKGLATRVYSCNGYIMFGNHRIGCWIFNKNGGRHGAENLSKAIQQSCNPYFMQLAATMNIQPFVEGSQMVGLGRKTGIELPSEDPGILPGSRAWRAANPNARMTPALIAMMSIGQGDCMATPLQLCAMTTAVANGGKYYKPRIIRRAIADNGTVLVTDTPKLEVDLIKAGNIKPGDFELIRRGMWMAVNQPGGTAGRVKMTNIEIAAKTGTAQTSDRGKYSNNSWIISFAPYDKPKYAVCVLAQNAGSGGAVCGPLVNMIYSGLFAQEQGLRLPLKAQKPYSGNDNRIDEITLPKDVLAALDTSPASMDEEVGDEAMGLAPVPVNPPTTRNADTPTPTFTPEVDDEGSVIPKAKPVTPR
ncbi:MAG: penicillin-binding protein 2 [Luteolibacter sp.]